VLKAFVEYWWVIEAHAQFSHGRMLLLLASPTLGAETEWQTLAPDVRVRLIATSFCSDGTTLAALEIDMPASPRPIGGCPAKPASLPNSISPVRSGSRE
jgi:hypothetical protein